MHLSVTIKNESVSKKVLEFLSAFKKEDVHVETLDEKLRGKNSFGHKCPHRNPQGQSKNL